VDDEQKRPILSLTDYSVASLLVDSGVHRADEWIEEDFTSSFKSDSVLLDVRSRLMDIPNEPYAAVTVKHVHSLCIYVVYFRVKGAKQNGRARALPFQL